MYCIDLNSDLGESFGAYKIGKDTEIIPLVSSVNLACGFHAGDPDVMAEATALCKAANKCVGAHPGFLDLQGFGRRNMSLSAKEVKNLVLYQIGALYAFCKSRDIELKHVKPHGALYNMAAKDYSIAVAICEAVREFDSSLVLLALSGSKMIEAAKNVGIPYASEVFADRAYEDDGSLVARSKPGSMIENEDEAVSRVIKMIKEHKVTTVSGKEIEIYPDSVCVHGDSEKALLFVKKITRALCEEGIEIKPLEEVIRQKEI